MILKEWFKRFHNRPLKIAAAFLLAVWFIFADRSYVAMTEKHDAAVKQMADLLSLTIDSKDRGMTESLLESLVNQSGAKSAALCEGVKQIVAANQDFSGCKATRVPFEKVVTMSIPGSGKLYLNAKFDLLASLSPLFSILAFGLLLVVAGFYFIQLAQSRIEKDILGPLLSKLLSDEPLEISELNDLRNEVRHAQDLEAQRAVTLAIQEHNRQVAHDIRSPIASINELLALADVKNAKIKSALEKALARANHVAGDLLNHGRISHREIVPSAFDVSQIIRDIAAEKQPRFLGGKIEVDVDEHKFVSTALSEGSLSRVLSNLVDNAMMACDDQKSISLSMRENDESLEITIEDSGRGIPEEILSKLGQRGVSARKMSEAPGTGLGVYSAMKALNDVGGSIEFESIERQGTKVLVRMPCIRHPKPSEDLDFILVDNEEHTRMTWDVKAQDAGMKIGIFSSTNELIASAGSISKDIPIFLDSDLGEGLRGESAAPDLRKLGFKRILLTTGFRDLHGSSIPGIEKVLDKSFDQALAAI